MPTINLPTLHADQVRAFWAPGRFRSLRCGRRWGKTTYAVTLACDGATKGKPVGFFAPDYKVLTETYQECRDILGPIKRQASLQQGVIRTTTGGRIDFWSMENDRAGRSRKYWKVIIDEAAFTKVNAIDIWERSISPTLLDYLGTADVMSNTNGDNPDNFFWKLCNEHKWGFKEFWAPTAGNPQMSRAELKRLQAANHPLVWAQEYEARFVNWAGVAFFPEEKLLLRGAPAPVPIGAATVYAIIDTAIKDGKEHDGTAVSYWARSPHMGVPLTCLDWDVVQIEGATLSSWLPGVMTRLIDLGRLCKARALAGVYIEDKGSGTVLLQQAETIQGNIESKTGIYVPVEAIPAALTAVGKDGRAMAISGHVHNDRVKFAEVAYMKTSLFKQQEKNHMLAQVTDFRMADPKAHTRADDLFDTFVYGVAIGLGNAEGF